MGMSMHAYAVKPADENYQRKAAAYRACEAARIPIPRELVDFFNGEQPDPTGVAVHIGSGHGVTQAHPCCARFCDSSREGFEVDITKLPEGTRFVRFYCAW
jgi:hypothetical protein